MSHPDCFLSALLNFMHRTLPRRLEKFSNYPSKIVAFGVPLKGHILRSGERRLLTRIIIIYKVSQMPLTQSNSSPASRRTLYSNQTEALHKRNSIHVLGEKKGDADKMDFLVKKPSGPPYKLPLPVDSALHPASHGVMAWCTFSSGHTWSLSFWR